MTYEPTRRQALRVTFAGLAASGVAGIGQPAAATQVRSSRTSRRDYQDRYRELFNACGKDPGKKLLVGQQMLDNYARDARVYRVPDRAAVVRMHAALVRQQHARGTGAKV
ncbi:hypothetical protein KBP30_01770 [Streptomyces sp. Go40/10]|uniref:hypothetical protein n=1 Tax=Streptomyces sp. Go40/10 TaxID=2825844 RepID=UPI001E2DC690|nr:hypothetical protein [Streptomyces sp. Go40/10]UFR00002.1 hypothetical protein KBP30_01770 [Streptomyces sp. Go40/10]